MRWVLACLVIGASACTLLTSLDEYGGTPPSDGGAAPFDAEASDAGTQPGDAAAPWCTVNAPDADFCADFDTKDLSQFDRVVTNGATPTLDTQAFVSPPSSLLVSAPASSADGGYTRGAVVHGTAGLVTDVTVSFDFRIDASPPAGGSAQIFKLVQRSGTGEAWEVGIALDPVSRKPTVFWYNFGNEAYQEPFTADNPVAIGQWVRIRFRLRVLGLLQGNFDMDLDGKRVASALGVIPALPAAQTDSVLGIVLVRNPHQGWMVRVDNVVFDAK